MRGAKILGLLAAVSLCLGTAALQAHHTGGKSGNILATGMASYYGAKFAGRKTANGERFNPSRMTAAHKTLRFGSRVRVTNIRNGRQVVVRINDRGPYAHGRIIDLSHAAARKIRMVRHGHVRVRLELLK